MKPSPERNLLEDLENPPRVEAPRDLAERIKAEIPETVAVAPAGPETTSPDTGWQWQRIAAILFVLVAGVLLTTRLQQEEVPGTPPQTIETSDAPAPPRVAESPAGEAPATSTAPMAVAPDPVETSGERSRSEPPDTSPPEPFRETLPAPAASAPERPTARGSGTNAEAPASEPIEEALPNPRDPPARALGSSLSIESEEAPRPGFQDSPAAAKQRDERSFTRESEPTRQRRSAAPDPPAPPPMVSLQATPPAEPIPMDAERFGSRSRRLEEEAAAIHAPMPPPPPPPIPDPGPRWITGRQEASPFLDPEDDPLSTFGLDVDTGSYAAVRRFLRAGRLPDRDAVRTEEMINYFDYGDPGPEEEDFSLVGEGAPSLYASGSRYYLVRFALTGREIELADRRPALLTFLVDTSGSMARPGRLDWVRRSLEALVERLQEGDRVALVTYGSRGRVLLEPTSDRHRLLQAIRGLQAEGSTHLEDGLALAYELARRFRRPHEPSRILLCSDGLANRGRTTAQGLLERARREADEGIELSTVGFGLESFNDELMEQLANQGDGRYSYVDSLDEAYRVFVERLSGTLETIAAEARAQVQWNPRTVALYRLIGYENREIADERFRDETVDAGEVGAGHAVTVLYEIKLERPVAPSELLATLRARYRSTEEGRTVELSRQLRGRHLAATWESASPALRLASLVAELGEILRQSYWARDGDLGDVFRRLQVLSGSFAGDRDVAELVDLAGRAAEIRERGSGL